MTREEAKHRLLNIESCIPIKNLEEARDIEALDMAIKALEQEPICPSHGIDCEDCPAYDPCGDAISRKAVLDIVDGYSVSQSNVEDVTQDIISDIMVLPSVNPQPKTGLWIKSKDGYMRCDQCGSRGSAIKARFCHHCGARMVESQESESKRYMELAKSYLQGLRAGLAESEEQA